MTLELTRGYVTKIDAQLPQHLEWIKSVRWYAHRSRSGIYARSRVHGFLHRVLARTRQGFQTDHLDGDTLNNTLGNLANVKQSKNIKRAWEKRKATVDETT